MNRLLKKSLSLFVTLGLLFSLLQMGQAQADAAVKVPDGEYSVPYRVLKDNTEEESTASLFIDLNSGKLSAQDGALTFVFTVTGFEWYKYVGYLKPGHRKSLDEADYTPAAVLSTAPGIDPLGSPMQENFGTVSIPIGSLSERIETLMHITVPPLGNYDHWYNVQLSLDTSSLPLVPAENGGGATVPKATLAQLDDQISAVWSVYGDTTEGYADGNYYPGSKKSLYLAVSEAQITADDAHATAEQLTQAYNSLAIALANHERLKVAVDRSVLQQLITEASAYAAGMKIFGTNAGTPATGSTAVVSEGETPKAQTDNLNNALLAASGVYNSAAATQFTIDNNFNLLNNYLNSAKPYLTTKESAKLLVLDTLQAESESSLAAYFKKDAEVLRSSFNVYANIFWKNIDNVNTSTIAYKRPARTGGFSGSAYKPVKINALSDSDTWAAQLTENADSQFTNPGGIVPLTFTTLNPSVTQTVYLSFNGNRLGALSAKVDEAQALHDAASEGRAPGQYPAGTKETLQAAIDNAEAVAAVLGSTRSEISGAATSLQTAVDTFKAAVVPGEDTYFSAVQATSQAFSTMDSYFLKPASLSTFDGDTYAALTIKDSSIIPVFKVKQDGELVDAVVVSKDEAANTRTVAFKVENPEGLVDAQVKIAQGAYQATHDIRLNFNGVDNSALSQAFSAASALHRTAKAGTAPGQYPANAIAAFKLAIDAAGAEAVRIPGSQQQTAAALDALQKAQEQFKAAVVPAPPKDGVYSIGYRILKYGTNQTSVMQDYVITPAKLTVSASKLTLFLTLKQDKEITALQFNGADTTVVSRNAADNTRIVSFPVANLAGLVDGKVKIEWPQAAYFDAYDIQLSLDRSSLTALEDEDGGTDPGTNPGTDPGTDPGPGTTPNTPATPHTPTTPNAGTDTGSETAPGTDSGTSPTPEIIFNDTQGHWAAESIQRAVQLGIAQGFGDGSFRPNATVSRAEIAVFLSRALKLEPATAGTAGLSDADKLPTWAKDHILSVTGAGLMTGYADTAFGAGDAITRAEIAVIVARALKLTLPADPILSFADANQIPAWAKGAVAAVAEAGLMEGRNNHSFDAKASLTRAEALTLIVRLLDILKKA